LILRHLTLLNQWNNTDGTTPSTLGTNFYNKLDLSNVGLLGHSRGGEGVRAAYTLYNSSGSHWQTDIPGLNIRGVFEIGPTDGQSSMVLNASNTAWHVILPSCDGDVRTNEGMKPFDRMLAAGSESPALPKSMFAVWGANHNFYNTYWQASDSPGCQGSTPLWNSGDSGSSNEQQTAIASAVSFFRAYVGSQADRSLASMFDPSNAVPSDLAQVTRVDRAFVSTSDSSQVARVETFQGANGSGSLQGQPEDTQYVTVNHTSVLEHDSSLKAAQVLWNAPGSGVYYQDNWTAPGVGLDLSSVGTLDFRVSRNDNAQMNPTASTDFTVQLVAPDGSLGPAVALSNYLSLVGPVGVAASGSTGADLHMTLATARIPMADLGSLSSARGVRFTFNSTATGDIFISDIDLTVGSRTVIASHPAPTETLMSQGFAAADVVADHAMKAFEFLSRGPASEANAQSSNEIVRIEPANDGSGTYEIEVQSAEAFPVRNALPVLRIQGKDYGAGYFSPTGDLHSMTFRLSPSEVDSLPSHFEIQMGNREDPRGQVRAFGSVSKSFFR
jgi:hypothetical protein